MKPAGPCPHEGLISDSTLCGGRWWWCPTCDTHLIENPDGTLTELEDRT